MTEPMGVVLAGSRAFVLAFLDAVTERTGNRPGVATDLSQAANLLPGAGLLVVEAVNPAWLAGVQRLAAGRPGVRIVAGLPRGADVAIAPLRAIGAEAIFWSDPGAFLAAIDRALVGGPEPAAQAEPVAEPAAPVAQAGLEPVAEPAAPVAAKSSEQAAAPPAVRPVPTGAFFDDVDLELPGPAPAMDPLAVASPAPWVPAGAWPASAPDLELSGQALLAALSGAAPPAAALAGVAGQVAGALSGLERAALTGVPLGIDVAPIRRSAAMRVRVGFAFAAAPPPGSPSDATAVEVLLREIDGLLAEVNGVASLAPAELAAEVGACRNALVKSAIDFSEAAQRYVPVAPAPPPSANTARRTNPGVRVLSDVKVTEAERRREGRSRRLVAALVACVLVAIAYHAWSFVTLQEQPSGPPVFAGMPEGTVGAESPDGRMRTLVSRTGQALDPEVVRKFREEEQLKGRSVVEVAPGVFASMPAAPPPREQAP